MSSDLSTWLTSGPSPRTIECIYSDPLDLIWLHVLDALDWHLTRSNEVFASWDGQAGLTLSTPEHLDVDDCLAQLIFHEICHALVEGPQGWSQPDWGLNNQDLKHLVNEFACHRVQASLAEPYNLRQFLAVTTDWRLHYEALPLDPMASCSFAAELDEQARQLASMGLQRASTAPWKTILSDALSQTATLKKICESVAPVTSLWKR